MSVVTEPFRLLVGDALEQLRTLPDESVQCVVTSPPYWGLRDYGVEGQIGLEPTVEEFIERLVAVFGDVRRVLRRDGVAWVNMGDSYACAAGGGQGINGALCSRRASREGVRERLIDKTAAAKPKDLVGAPWLFAFAMRGAGWWLRSDIIWAKPNPMPESVADRPTKAHEYVFLFAKSESYFFDGDAISEPATKAGAVLDYTGQQKSNQADHVRERTKPKGRLIVVGERRRPRTVWSIGSQPYDGAHFAVMPPTLAKRCIMAGSRSGDVVLDPFAGSCTTGAVALDLGRRFVGIELNPAYAELGRERCTVTLGLPLEAP